ncbi:circularly permuted type 2 ATP-grasp protein [Sphingobacterium bovisgrunnientis]|jgi:uncharacterized circularly permuted ATP-grasp superfamily protein|uniref:circularly permuted type 2 ATP-grasp protein n=1 Tax=Sphingobacterium bovisgrunnientis TaxID=1874697 RepID=UPI0021D3A7EF|nr:circularly permuted type 2 ATP-grasp protein [Sphingobacterium bovisgrunnientis]
MKNGLLTSYSPIDGVYDEMIGEVLRPQFEKFIHSLGEMDSDSLTLRNEMTKKLFMREGITFTVYSDGEGIEKIFPFDIIPRVIQCNEWEHIESGVRQRIKALNIFLKDIYHQQFILRDGIIPSSLVFSCPNYLRQMMHVDVPFDIYTHISGIDLIRDSDGSYYMLEE